MLSPALHYYSQLAVISPPTLVVAAGIIQMLQQKLSGADTVDHAAHQWGSRCRTSLLDPAAAVVHDGIIAEPPQNTSRSKRVRLDWWLPAMLHCTSMFVLALHPAEHNTAFSWTKSKEDPTSPKPSILLPLLTFSGLTATCWQIKYRKNQRSTSQPVVGCFCLTEMLFFVFIPLKTPQTHHCLSRWLKEWMKTGPQSQKWSALEIFQSGFCLRKQSVCFGCLMLMYRRASEWGLRTFQNHIWSPFDQSSRFFTCQTNQCTFEMVRYCCSGPSYALVNVSLGALSGFALAKDSVHQTLFL